MPGRTHNALLLNPGFRLGNAAELLKSADVGVLPTEILILESGLWLNHTANSPCRILNMQSDGALGVCILELILRLGPNRLKAVMVGSRDAIHVLLTSLGSVGDTFASVVIG